MASIQQGPTDWPLVGRSAQIELIDATYAGGTAGVVMLGEAGVGKTRLAREAWQRIAAQGCPAHWITATRSAAAVPLGALAPLLAPATDAAGNGTRGAAVHGGAVHGEERAVTPDAVRSLWTTGATTRIEVTALADGDIDQLLELGLNGPTDALSARELRRIVAAARCCYGSCCSPGGTPAPCNRSVECDGGTAGST